MHSVQSTFLVAAALSVRSVFARSFAGGKQCGVEGYSTKVNAYYYDNSGANAAYAQCAAHCLKDYRCDAFAIDDDDICMHFSIPVSGNFKADSDSPYIFYDRSCVAVASSSPTPTGKIYTTSARTAVVSSATTNTRSTAFSTSMSTKTLTQASTLRSSGTTTSTPASTTSSKSVSLSTSTVNPSSSSKPNTTFSTAIAASTSTSNANSLATSSGTSMSSTVQTFTTSAIAVSSTNSMTKSSTPVTTVVSSPKTTLATSPTSPTPLTVTAAVSTIATSSATLSSTAVVVPSGCNIPTLYTVTDFYWFNSTHNLDCLKTPDVSDGLGCIAFDSEGIISWCDPNKDKNCTICNVDVCSTGLPPQPYGYGAPDDVKFTFSDGSVCEQVNPAVANHTEVGQGYVNCGSSYDFMNFYGTSDADVQMGTVEVNGIGSRCADGDTITGYYSTQFRIDCKHDAQFNATCTTPSSFTIPLIRFSKTKRQ